MPLAKDPKATEGLESRLRARRKDDSVERATTAVIEGHLLASHLDGTRVQHTDASGGHLNEGVNEARHTGTERSPSSVRNYLRRVRELGPLFYAPPPQ